MPKKIQACLVCGEELIYYNESREMECVFCHGKFMSNASCKSGHFVCDRCHSAEAVKRVRALCLESRSDDPYKIAVKMMRDSFVHMHGPENHALVGLALLAAWKNAGGAVKDMEKAADEVIRRAMQVPGGSCGFSGCCGAAVGSGIFVSVVLGSTPLAKEEFGLCNLMTSESLAAIGELGGPRCCKRGTFLAIGRAVGFCRERLGVNMRLPERLVCGFFPKNAQCMGSRCPFNPAHKLE